MADERDIYNELEAQRNKGEELEEPEVQSEPWEMGAGSYILILFALFVDIIEILTVYTGVGAIVAIPLGLVVDIAIFAGVGLSRKSRKQWKRFAAGFVAENFPFLSSFLEIIPFRTLALIWMYRGMSQPLQGESEEKENEQ